jgi:hypothetical protein
MATRRTLLLAGAAAALGASRAAAPRFPSRPVQLVAPFEAGGGLDLHARALAPAIEATLGQPVVVVNRRGAAVARAPAHGHTGPSSPGRPGGREGGLPRQSGGSAGDVRAVHHLRFPSADIGLSPPKAKLQQALRSCPGTWCSSGG